MDHCCKVGRVLARYDLEYGVRDGDLEQYLLARWRGEGEYSATGLRPLNDWLNKQILKSVYTEHDRGTLGTRIDAEYDAISGEQADLAVLDDLEADGIDGESLRADFLSTTTLYRHFTNCLDASKSTRPSDSGGASEWEADKVEYAREILERNVTESLQSLETKDRLPEASRAAIKTEIVLGCPDCGTQVSFERAIGRGYICQDHMGRDPVETDDVAPSGESS